MDQKQSSTFGPLVQSCVLEQDPLTPCLLSILPRKCPEVGAMSWQKTTTNFHHMLLGLENEPPPPGVDGEEKRKEEDMEDGETKEDKNGENSYRNEPQGEKTGLHGF